MMGSWIWDWQIQFILYTSLLYNKHCFDILLDKSEPAGNDLVRRWKDRKFSFSPAIVRI